MTKPEPAGRFLFENAAVFDGVTPKLGQGDHRCWWKTGNPAKVAAGPLDAGERQPHRGARGKRSCPRSWSTQSRARLHRLLAITPPEPPLGYRAQYAHKFLRHILSCGFSSVRDVAGGDHGMAMAC